MAPRVGFAVLVLHIVLVTPILWLLLVPRRGFLSGHGAQQHHQDCEAFHHALSRAFFLARRRAALPRSAVRSANIVINLFYKTYRRDYTRSRRRHFYLIVSTMAGLVKGLTTIGKYSIGFGLGAVTLDQCLYNGASWLRRSWPPIDTRFFPWVTLCVFLGFRPFSSTRTHHHPIPLL